MSMGWLGEGEVRTTRGQAVMEGSEGLWLLPCAVAVTAGLKQKGNIW